MKWIWLALATVMTGFFAVLVLGGAPWQVWFPFGVMSGMAIGKAMVA